MTRQFEDLSPFSAASLSRAIFTLEEEINDLKARLKALEEQVDRMNDAIVTLQHWRDFSETAPPS